MQTNKIQREKMEILVKKYQTTLAVLSTKINAVKNKLSSVSGLVKKSFHDGEISDPKGKYFAASDYNKFSKKKKRKKK